MESSSNNTMTTIINLSNSAKSTAALLLAICDPLTEFSSPFVENNNNSNDSNNNNKNDEQEQDLLLKVHENLTYQRYGINAQRIPDASSSHYAWNMLLKYASFVGDKSVEKKKKGKKSSSLSEEMESFLLVRHHHQNKNLSSSSSSSSSIDVTKMNSEELDIYELFGYTSVGTSEKENTIKQSGQRRDRNDEKEKQQANDTLPPLSQNQRNFALLIQQLALCVACLIVGYKSRGTLQHIYPVCIVPSSSFSRSTKQ